MGKNKNLDDLQVKIQAAVLEFLIKEYGDDGLRFGKEVGKQFVNIISKSVINMGKEFMKLLPGGKKHAGRKRKNTV